MFLAYAGIIHKMVPSFHMQTSKYRDADIIIERMERKVNSYGSKYDEHVEHGDHASRE